MLRRLIAICGFAAAGLFFAATANAEALDAAPWHFRVTFPCQSGLSSQTADTAAGRIVLTYYSCGDDKAAFMVVVNDYPAGLIKQDDIATHYAGAVNGMAEEVKGTVRNVGVYSLANIDGREAVIDVPDKHGAVKSRIFLVGDRLYQATCIGDAGIEAGTDCKAFLDSFTLVGIDALLKSAPPPAK